jgi:hypothetical protein
MRFAAVFHGQNTTQRIVLLRPVRSLTRPLPFTPMLLQRACTWYIDRLKRCCEQMGKGSLHCSFPGAAKQEQQQQQPGDAGPEQAAQQVQGQEQRPSSSPQQPDSGSGAQPAADSSELQQSEAEKEEQPVAPAPPPLPPPEPPASSHAA